MQNDGRLEAVLAAWNVSQVTGGIDTHRVFEACGWPRDEAQPTMDEINQRARVPGIATKSPAKSASRQGAWEHLVSPAKRN